MIRQRLAEYRRRWARRSIAARLLLAVLLIVCLALPVTGTFLSHHYRESATQSFDNRLMAMLNVLLAGISVDAKTGQLVMDRPLGDARFEQVFSGWYWQVSDADEHALTSRSLWDQRLPLGATDEKTRTLEGPRGQSLRVVERDIYLPSLPTALHVSIAASDTELTADIRSFTQWLWGGLAVLGAVLLGVLALQIRWGLSPLRRLRTALQAIEEGRSEQLPSDFPDELNALATGMNALLARDQRLIERGRHTAGNLAHALKTPLSVMRLQLTQLPEAQKPRWEAELTRIDNAVRHHLARASAAGEGARLAPLTLSATLAPMLSGLGKLAQRRGLHLEVDWHNERSVYLDAQDAQELVGNLLDNALRWANQRVTLQGRFNHDRLTLTISDDGPGMSDEQCQAALERGRRLDEQRSQSGLGLSIVVDLVALYQGELQLSRSVQGGLMVTVILPVVAQR
ncbi:ATP-binding protein [Halomonas sp. LS-001]